MMESLLQLTDHWVTIIAGIFTVLLAIVAIWLTKKTYILTKNDEQKTIAINELKKQTENLEQLYLMQIAPRFVIKPTSSDYIKVVNIGNDAYNVEVKSNKEIDDLNQRAINAFKDFFSAGTEKTFRFDYFKEHEFLFIFEDKIGNKYSQKLFVGKRKFSNLEELTKIKNSVK